MNHFCHLTDWFEKCLARPPFNVVELAAHWPKEKWPVSMQSLKNFARASANDFRFDERKKKKMKKKHKGKSCHDETLSKNMKASLSYFYVNVPLNKWGPPLPPPLSHTSHVGWGGGEVGGWRRGQDLHLKMFPAGTAQTQTMHNRHCAPVKLSGGNCSSLASHSCLAALPWASPGISTQQLTRKPK